jgi:transposase
MNLQQVENDLHYMLKSKDTARMLAIHSYFVEKKKVSEIAKMVGKTTRSIYRWINRYMAEGRSGLYDKPRSGRPPKVPYITLLTIFESIIKYGWSPKKIREIVRQKTNIKYHITHIRRILHKFEFRQKKAESKHEKQTSMQEIKIWQGDTIPTILRLDKQKCIIAACDEAAFFKDGGKNDYKLWVHKSRTFVKPYAGKKEKIHVFGLITTDGRQLFSSYDVFNADTFIKFLKDVQKKIGKKILIVMDNAKPHTCGKVKEFLKDNPDIRIVYLPKYSAFLNAAEECWHQIRQNPEMAEYFETLEDMEDIIFKFVRANRFDLDIIKYLKRQSKY